MTPNQQELRELDAWIAVNLFGWEWLTRSNYEPDRTVVRRAIFPPENSNWIRFNYSHSADWGKADMSLPLFSDWDKACAERDDENLLGNKRKFGLPHYSTDPAAAMEVLKKCLENFAGKQVSQLRVDEGYQVFHSGSFYLSSKAEGETLELAICRFAKKLFTK